MSVFVDPAVHPYRNMVMCHMWADTLDELLAMAAAIGVKRQWLQQPPKASWVHFDIAKSKRSLAVKFGAIQTDRFEPLIHCGRLLLASDNPAIAGIGRRRLEMALAARTRGARDLLGIGG